MTDRNQLEAAIAAQEALRGTLDDAIVDATIAALRSQLDQLDVEMVEHERRPVTVLFVDVVDSTRLLRDLDPEETMAVLDSALHQLAEPVAARGGKVTRFMGDGFLAVFGLRRARENDPVQAVHAGLDIVSRSAEVAAASRSEFGIEDLRVRVGINTGLVVTGGVTEAEDTIMGSTVNLAARIEAAAEPGTVLVSHETYRHIHGSFATMPSGTIEAKGFARPVPVYVVSGTIDAHPYEDERWAFIGRAEELTSLHGAIEAAVSESRLEMITLIGDAGIGKSRLIEEVHRATPPGLRWFHARAPLEHADVPYALVRDLVAATFDLQPGDPPDIVTTKLRNGLGRYLTSAEQAVDVLGRVLGYDTRDTASEALTPQQLRDLSSMHLAEFVRAATADTGGVLVCEDLQWADPASIEMLGQLTADLSDAPVVVLASGRPAFAADRPEWGEGHRARLLQIGPLLGDDAELLVDASLAEVHDCPSRFRTMLRDRAGGNPYFLQELIEMCLDDGIIVTDDRRLRVSEDMLVRLRLPPTLSGVVQARLDALPPELRSLLQDAAVVGTVFWDDVLAALAPVVDPGDLGNTLERLRDRHMIRERTPSAFIGTREYEFATSVLRDATYEGVLLGTRRAHHGIVADWLMAHADEDDIEFQGAIAGHLERSERHGEALRALTRAAESAWRSYAVDPAADLYDRALALVEEEDLDTRYGLLLGRQRCWFHQGRPAERDRALDELEGVVERLGDPSRQMLVAVERTWHAFYAGAYDDARRFAERAVAFAERAADAGLQSRAETALAWALLAADDMEKAHAHATRGLDLAADAGHDDRRAEALNALGMVAVATGELSAARRALADAIEIARALGDRDGESTYLNNLGVTLTVLGDYDAAYETFDATVTLSEDVGDRLSLGTSRTNLAWVAASQGRWDHARGLAESSVEAKRSHGHADAEAEALLWLGHALMGLKRPSEARAAYHASLAIREELGQVALALGVHAGLARAALAEGNIESAKEHAEAIVEHLDEGGSLEGTWEPLRLHLTAVEVLRAAGDERADRVLTRAGAELRDRAARIADDDDRRTFLESIPWHRRIVELLDER